MDKTNKHQAMWEYLTTYPGLQSYLKFNTVDSIPDETSISTVFGEEWETKYTRGHGIKRYDFAIIAMKLHDTGTSNLNIEEMFNVEKFMDWIELQNKNKNFPYFGENLKILSIENLQNMPNLAGVDTDGSVAKYMFQCRVRYYV